MKQATFSNAIQCAIATILAILAFVTGVFTLTIHNIFFGVMAAAFARVLYVDNLYGESVKHYFQRKRGK